MRFTDGDLWIITQNYKNDLVTTIATDTKVTTDGINYTSENQYVFSGIGKPEIKKYIYAPSGSTKVSPIEIDSHVLIRHLYNDLIVSATPEVYVSAVSAQPYLPDVRKGDFLISPTENRTFIATTSLNNSLSGDWQEIVTTQNGAVSAATIPLAKLTTMGMNGSLQILNGIIVGYTSPT